MKRLTRLARIVTVGIRYRLDELLDPAPLPFPLRCLLYPWRILPRSQRDRGERLRLALEALGPIFIKFGQLLSTRPDLIPADIARQLSLLQDQVAPFPSEQAVALIEQALGQPVEELFSEFSRQPMASASIAQVHPARLPNGRAVVVKVVRPGIDRIVSQDLALLTTLARWAERYLPNGHRLRPVEVVADYRQTILDELDLQHEGANTSQLRRNFLHSEALYIPEVFWDYSRRNVLVVERIHGIPVTDVPALKAAGIHLPTLAELGVEIFFTQVFRDRFFHADMHPGNIFVNPERRSPPQYIGIDCAIIGTLSEFDQYYLARNLLAMFRRNYREVAELHVESGWVPPSTRVSDFEAAIRTVCEPIFEKPLGEISFAHVLIQLFQTAQRFDMEVQPSLVLLQKTLLNVEGLGRELYPDLDLWNTARPLLERWLWERYSPASLARRVTRQLPGWLEQLPRVPDKIIAALDTPIQQLPALQLELAGLRQELADHRRTRRRQRGLATLLLLAAVLTAAPLWMEQPEHLWPAAALAAAAIWLWSG